MYFYLLLYICVFWQWQGLVHQKRQGHVNEVKSRVTKNIFIYVKTQLTEVAKHQYKSSSRLA